MIKVSVIIPVYNTEKYLGKCLDSVCAQTLKEIETICVNDASTDNSLSILKEYASQDERIKLIDLEENKGVAAARNAGMNVTKGEYIGFVDSDDWIDSTFFEKLYLQSDNGNVDIVKGADLHVLKNGNQEIWQQNDLIKQNKMNFWAQFTTAIYKNSLVKNQDIKFDESLLVCEDINFLMEIVYQAKNIAFADDAIYFYAKREASLDTAKYSIAKIKSFIDYIYRILNFIENRELQLSEKQILLTRLIAQTEMTRKYRVEEKSKISELTSLYNKLVVKKMRLK